MTYEESIKLTDVQWSGLSDDKKLEVLQTIENHSAFESGRLSCPVIGKYLYTGVDGIVLGTYDPQNRVIYVNDSQFASDSKYGKDAEALVTACLHEGRHAYQHQVVEGSVQHDNSIESDAWRENLKDGNYISFRDNPRAYYNQPVEVDARKYAEEKYIELVTQRQSHELKQQDEYSPKEVFERQLSESPVIKEAASFQKLEYNSNDISIS